MILAIDVTAGGTTAAQKALAVVLVAVFLLVLAILRYRFKFEGLDERQRDEKNTLWGQRQDQDPRSIRFEPGDLADRRAELWALFDRDESGPVDDRETVASALSEVRQALAIAYQEYTRGVPRLSLGLGLEAVLVIVFGAVAVYPAGFWRALFTTSGDGLSLGDILDVSVSLTTSVISTGVDIVALFPLADLLYALALTAVIEVGTAIYTNPVSIAGLLIAAAGLVLYQHQDVPEAVGLSIWDSWLTMAAVGVASTAVVWLAGVIPAGIGAALGYPRIGAAVGWVFVVVVGLKLTWELGTDLFVRFRMLGAGGLSRTDYPVVAYVLTRRLGGVVALVIAPFVLVWTLVAILEGRLLGVLGAFANGSLSIQVVVTLAVLAFLAVLALQTRETWPEVRAALVETLSRRAVRLALFRRGVPWVVVVVGYFLAIGFGAGAGIALVVGLGAGVVIRLLLSAFERARYRASLLESDPTTASRAVVQAYRFETTDGDDVFYATVNDVELAHTDREAVVEAIVDTAEQLFANGEVEPSVEQAFATDAFRFGIVDIEETRKKLTQEVREQIVHELRTNENQVPVEELEGELERYPRSVWRPRLREWVQRGDLRRKNGYYQRV